MAGDDEELEAETSMKLAAVIVNGEAGANGDGGDDDESYEDSDADDDQALRAYRETRVAELKAAQARKAEGGLLVQVSKASWEARGRRRLGRAVGRRPLARRQQPRVTDGPRCPTAVRGAGLGTARGGGSLRRDTLLPAACP